MLKIRVHSRLLGGGGLALVCSAGVALGFQSPPVGDPTVLTPMMCEGVYAPPWGTPIPNTHPAEDCLNGTFAVGLPAVDLSPLYSESGTWFADPIPWNKDRRPAVFVQLASSTHVNNSRGNHDWWWINRHLHPSERLLYVPDEPVDFGHLNPDLDSEHPIIPVWVYNGPGGPPQFPEPNGEPDQFEWLVRQMRHHVEEGFRRFILHIPAGVTWGKNKTYIGPPGGDLYDYFHWIVESHAQSMNQFRALPLWKQYYFCGKSVTGGESPNNVWTAFVNEFCGGDPSYDPAFPDRVSIEIYVGSELGDGACGLSTGPTPNTTRQKHTWVDGQVNQQGILFPHFTENERWGEPYPDRVRGIPFDPRDGSHMQRLWYEIGPWWKAGARTIWLDAGSENRADDARLFGTLELSQNPSFASIGLRFGGETVPTDSTAQIPNDCAIQKMRWLCTDSVAFNWENYSQGATSARTLKTGFKWSRQASEVHLIGQKRPLDWEEWRKARDKGFVVDVFNCFSNRLECELAKRWYSMGEIQVADFNGDGEVTPEDSVAFSTAYNSSYNTDIKVFATGDINQDGLVDQADVTDFLTYYYDYINSTPTTRPLPTKFGLADDL